MKRNQHLLLLCLSMLWSFRALSGMIVRVEGDVWFQNDSDAIIVSLSGTEAITEVALTVEFDESEFSVTEFYVGSYDDFSRPFELWTVHSLTHESGRIVVSASGPSVVVWNNPFLVIEGIPLGPINPHFEVNVSGVTINGGTVNAEIDNGTIEVKGESMVSGMVTWLLSGNPVEDFALNLSGDSHYGEGTYEIKFYSMNEDEYWPTIKAHESNPVVSNYDAYLITSYLNGNGSLSEDQRLSADVDNDGFVTETDLEYILLYAIGDRNKGSPLVDSPYLRFPETRNAPPRGDSLSDQDFVVERRGNVGEGSFPSVTGGVYYFTVSKLARTGQDLISVWMDAGENTVYSVAGSFTGNGLSEGTLTFGNGTKGMERSSIYGPSFSIVIPEGKAGLFFICSMLVDDSIFPNYGVSLSTVNEGISTFVLSNTLPDELDRDHDGITDVEEVEIYGTNPDKVDSDGDKSSDLAEIEFGSDPLDKTSYFWSKILSYEKGHLTLRLNQYPNINYTIEFSSNPEGPWEKRTPWSLIPWVGSGITDYGLDIDVESNEQLYIRFVVED